MKNDFKVAIDILSNKIESKQFLLHYADDKKPCIESQNLAIFANENMINNNEQGQQHKTTMNDLEMFVRVIIVCCFYGQSPKAMWDEREGFPFLKKQLVI